MRWGRSHGLGGRDDDDESAPNRGPKTEPVPNLPGAVNYDKVMSLYAILYDCKLQSLKRRQQKNVLWFLHHFPLGPVPMPPQELVQGNDFFNLGGSMPRLPTGIPHPMLAAGWMPPPPGELNCLCS